jgi:hypothetical protein
MSRTVEDIVEDLRHRAANALHLDQAMTFRPSEILPVLDELERLRAVAAAPKRARRQTPQQPA